MKKDLFSTLFFLLSLHYTMGENDEIRIALIGVTGSGKSATANSILGRSQFAVSGTSSLVTKNCESATTKRFGRKLIIVDTPGFFDTDHTADFKSVEERILPFLSPGPHAILYVLQAGHYEPEEKEGMNMFIRLFGEEILHHTILVFTHNTSSETEYMKDLHDDLKDILDRCQSRYIFLPPPHKKQEHEYKMKKLHVMIDALLVSTKFAIYAEDKYKRAHQANPFCRLNRDYCEMYEKEKAKAEDARRLEAKIQELRKENELAREEHEQKLLELKVKMQVARAHEKEIDSLRQAMLFEQEERQRKYQRRRRPFIKIGPITLF